MTNMKLSAACFQLSYVPNLFKSGSPLSRADPDIPRVQIWTGGSDLPNKKVIWGGQVGANQRLMPGQKVKRWVSVRVRLWGLGCSSSTSTTIGDHLHTVNSVARYSIVVKVCPCNRPCCNMLAGSFKWILRLKPDSMDMHH